MVGLFVCMSVGMTSFFFLLCIDYSDLKTINWQKDILADIIPNCSLLPSMECNMAWPEPTVLVYQNRNHICYLKRKGQLFCSRFWKKKKNLAKINKLWNISIQKDIFLFNSMWVYSLSFFIPLRLFICLCVFIACKLHIFKVSRKAKIQWSQIYWSWLKSQI